MNIQITDAITEYGYEAMKLLNDNGFQAYLVGGFVRDLFIPGRSSSETDIDITTDATPQQVMEVFAEYPVIPTGLKHGTVTVLMKKDAPVEITTYRIDGEYSDGRHPDTVSFTRNLRDDLARRDFTMNALAADCYGNIEDYFGGIDDIKLRRIKAIGVADTRFHEDALRILRALRFASVLEFTIDRDTEDALFRCKDLLNSISGERIYVELIRLVQGASAGYIVRKYVDIIAAVIPELGATKGFNQNNSHHKYDVLEHSIRTMEYIETTDDNRAYMKLAGLLHDIGKPETYSEDENGIGHFYGHAEKGEEILRVILNRLHVDSFTIKRVCTLVKYHLVVLDTSPKLLRRWMNRLGPDVLYELLALKRADNKATGTMTQELADKFDEIERIIDTILEEEQCFSIKDLAVTGRDIIDMGAPEGKLIGSILSQLLDKVIEGELPNKKGPLLQAAAQLIESAE